MSERYILLGEKDDTLFFLHKSNRNIREVSLNLYSNLLYNNMINIDTNVVIFQLNANCSALDTLCIQHKDRTEYYDYDKEYLEYCYNIFINESRTEISEIRYMYDTDVYNLNTITNVNIVLNFERLKVNNKTNFFFSNYKKIS